jgi:hypothetical protein
MRLKWVAWGGVTARGGAGDMARRDAQPEWAETTRIALLRLPPHSDAVPAGRGQGGTGARGDGGKGIERAVEGCMQGGAAPEVAGGEGAAPAVARPVVLQSPPRTHKLVRTRLRHRTHLSPRGPLPPARRTGGAKARVRGSSGGGVPCTRMQRAREMECNTQERPEFAWNPPRPSLPPHPGECACARMRAWWGSRAGAQRY